MDSRIDPRESPLLPAGHRWGRGAQAIVPYLTHTRPSHDEETVEVDLSINNPVFMHMEHTLRMLLRGH